MANLSPLVIFRPADTKVVLVPRRSAPIIVEPSRTTSLTIKRSDIPGPQGEKGDRGDPGPPGEVGGLPAVLDGGNF